MPTLCKQTLIDISVSIHPKMPVFPGDPGFSVEPFMDMNQGEVANVCCLQMGSQLGTHYDAPHHILNNGQTMESIPLEACYGPAQVIEIPNNIQAIDADVLKQYDLGQAPRLLLKTRNSAFWQTHPTEFRTDYAALTEDGALYLGEQGILLLGIDYLSVELYDSVGLKAHKALFHHDVAILEGLNLTEVLPGCYTLIAFPLKVENMDGASTRAMLLLEERP